MITILIIYFCLLFFFIFLTYYTGVYFDNKRYNRWRNASGIEIQEYEKEYGYKPVYYSNYFIASTLLRLEIRKERR